MKFFNKRTKLTALISAMIIGTLMFSGCTSEGSNSEGSEEIIEENVEQEEEESSMEEVVDGYKFVSASKLNVREEASANASIVNSLLRGTRIKILNEVNDEENNLWYEVNYHTFEGEETGFLSAEFTVDKREDLLGEDLRGLDFSPFHKVEYESNPKVEVKGVYVTIHSAAGAKLNSLLELADETEINAFVIDVKDDYGNMLFKTDAAEKYAPTANQKAPIKDIEEFLKKLNDRGIYTIARIVSFKDPTYASYNPEKVIINKETGKPFVNSDNILWVSPHDRDLWDYNIGVSVEAAKAGFNEIQFDYVRFPASNGGKLDAILDYRNELGEGKPETIQNYLKKAYEAISKEEAYVSADIYGLVPSVPDDMQLGQYWEAISNYTDYISPMMYPSHYANGTYGIPVPDADPYGVLFYGSRDSVMRNRNLETPATIRPWIQSFTAAWVPGYISYGPDQIKAQIKGMNDAGVSQYLLWSASNNYNIK
ncbi:outer membrane murein-binding lipoprotein Lpp [Acetoanaerobium pronyense]|uniref:Outer membrane murein-binding lipoprotein Lpp n=1 Tax=Acetoanaerobium pronyense TaxID=1482736 RepID=A0ABS4KGX7_9FIRM|nr:putative glycoside hydrolase [Acetoanaerobium pronyense]MBP2026386.1 outer membrane murein-binding lipoprotein Lpp [Acetoanaerobium pronyense]